ncbi:MAG: CDP-diacylglycerol--glycerol-3-phosphate 3-phosphatidyltransferase, partial [Alphaproteobacteria bacterium GWB1_45_5]
MTNLFKKELFAFFILLSFHFSWVHSFFMIKLDGMTLANILTLFRILILFPFIGMFYIDAHWANGVAVVLYLTACFTDYLDGMVARGFNHVSTFGKFLDPIADKLLIATTIIMLAGTGRLEGTALLPALIILGREIFISGLREHLSLENVNVPVSVLAKWKTAVQMISLSYLLADGPKKYVWGFQEVGVV